MKLGNELISVVIPTHNRSKLLMRAIDSALNQTYNNIEIIVVSDGSTDDTDLVMELINAQNENLKYIPYHPGKGGNYARNIGVKAAEGEFVAFLDDDDEWHKDKLQKQIDVFNSNSEIGLVCTGIHAVYENEKVTTIFIPPAPLDSSKKILLGNCIGSTTTVMIKSALIKQDLFDESLEALQDYDLWIRLCQKTKVGVVKEPCVEYYNYKGTNQISQFTDRYKRATKHISDKYRDLIKELSKAEQKDRRIWNELLLAKKSIRNGNSKVARQYIKRAIKIKCTKQCLILWVASFFSPPFVRKVKSVLGSVL